MSILGSLTRKAIHAAAPSLISRNRDFSEKDRKKLAKKGEAMPDGGYPIANEGDLKNAIKAYGRAKNPEAVKRHIKSRAKSLGLTRLLPDKWKDEHGAKRARIATAINLQGGSAPEWVELIPGGTFKGRDGRGPFHMHEPDKVIEASASLDMTAGLPIDYDHATDYAAPQGGQAPAAGWIKKLKVGSNGSLWGQVEWTEKGGAAVAAKEWRYISPVFEYDEEGNVTCLLRAGLTNNPNLKLQAVASREGTMRKLQIVKMSKGEDGVLVFSALHAGKPVELSINAGEDGDINLAEAEKAIKKIWPEASAMEVINVIEAIVKMKSSGNPEAAEEGDEEGEEASEEVLGNDDETNPPLDEAQAAECARLGCNAEHGEHMPECRMAAESPYEGAHDADDGDAEEMAAEMAKEMHAGEGEPSEETMAKAREAAKRVIEARKAKAARKKAEEARMNRKTRPAGGNSDRAIQAVTTELNELKAERAKEKAELAVNAAITSGKLIPAQRAWAMGYATRDLAGFNAFIEKQPKVIGSDGKPIGEKPPVKPATAVSAREADICAKLGLDPAKYGEHREAFKGAGAIAINGQGKFYRGTAADPEEAA